LAAEPGHSNPTRVKKGPFKSVPFRPIRVQKVLGPDEGSIRLPVATIRCVVRLNGDATQAKNRHDWRHETTTAQTPAWGDHEVDHRLALRRPRRAWLWVSRVHLCARARERFAREGT